MGHLSSDAGLLGRKTKALTKELISLGGPGGVQQNDGKYEESCTRIEVITLPWVQL